MNKMAILLLVLSFSGLSQARNIMWTQVGGTTIGSDGSSYTQIGNTTVGSDGSSYTRIGNTIVGSDGSSCVVIGDMVSCRY